jgi:hypothetical protein
VQVTHGATGIEVRKIKRPADAMAAASSYARF